MAGCSPDVADVRYAETSAAQSLDLYLPTPGPAPSPLVVFVHGGAFRAGDKADPRPQFVALRGRGYAVASLNYRLSGEAPFPAGVEDVLAAVRWLRAHAARYGIDPDRFGAWGESAGGYFAVMLGILGGRSTRFDDAAPGRPEVSSAVHAVIDFYGPADFLTMDAKAVDPGGCPGTPMVHDDPLSPESSWLGAAVQTVPQLARRASPISHLSGAGDLPPFRIVHGARDCLVPHGQSVQLYAALRRHGARAELILLERAGHGGPEFDRDQLGPAIDFLDEALGSGRQPASGLST
jgi:acetyl esterase/lipase